MDDPIPVSPSHVAQIAADLARDRSHPDRVAHHLYRLAAHLIAIGRAKECRQIMDALDGPA